MKKIIILPVLAILLAISASAGTQIIAEAERHFEKANELLKRTDYDGAIAEYNKVINLSSGSKISQDAQYWIGQSQLRAGRFDAAQATFAKLIEQYPTSAIVPVTKLMVERAEQAKQEQAQRKARSNAADKGYIIDPETGVKYVKTRTLTGTRNVFRHSLNLSPNGKFLLRGTLVIPLDGGDSFELVDMPVMNSSWSPDAKRVAFYSLGAIWVIPVSPETSRPTGPAKKLLDGGTYGRYGGWVNPSWSPDSEKIVFERSDIKNKRRGIWTLSVRDGVLTQITDTGGDPIWSPDGKTIAYKYYRKGGEKLPVLEAWLVSAEGGTPRKIDIEQGRLLSWHFSHDSEWLVYMLGAKLQLFHIADERVIDIFPPEDVGMFYFWSSDGKKLLFCRKSYEYKEALRVVSASGGPSIELGEQLKLIPYDRFWSPDSRMIVVEGRDKESNYQFWVIPLAGGDPFPLKLDVSIAGEPDDISLSPDCRKLLFSVRQSDKTENFYVAPVSLEDARNTGPAVLAFSGYVRVSNYRITRSLSWSPDGQKLTIVHKGDIWIASTEGGGPVRITNTPEDEGEAQWSPDGKMIAYGISYSEKEQALRVISVSGSETTKILDIPGDYDFAWSPDGKALALIRSAPGFGQKGASFFRSEGMISAISIPDGKIRQILELKEQPMDQAWGMCWSPGGRNLGFVGWKAAGDPWYQILIVSEETGKVTGIAPDDGAYDCISWSPDGKWISYDSAGSVKVRPEATMWEADFDQIVKSASRN
ncbi:MAG TPA: tetratricopeptide repeat protein [Sedimentisphaerales bacterium]|nr:tetratricopeptide repeat protein [Sedimentisphaerales bacterium]